MSTASESDPEPPPLLRRVGVIGSGRRDHEGRASRIGAALARLDPGVHLLTGGGRGAMEGAARGFVEARKAGNDHGGRSIGVLPAGPPPGYPNPWIEIPIRTHLPATGEEGTSAGSRNHLIVLSADLLIAVPGSAGTRSELLLALKYDRPAVGWVERRDEFPGIPEGIPIVESLEEALAWARETLRALPAPGAALQSRSSNE